MTGCSTNYSGNTTGGAGKRLIPWVIQNAIRDKDDDGGGPHSEHHRIALKGENNGVSPNMN